MDDQTLPTKDRLIRTAAELFRTRGYNGVGLSELLTAAKSPKGSLYHHFPNGKSDLAIAASTWASDQMLRTIAASFGSATSFQDGATTLCHKLAKLFDLSNQWDGCPVSATLFEGPDNQAFLDHATHLFEGWISEVAHHAERLGMAPDEAREAADSLYILVQGGWLLARTRRSSDVLRFLPKKLRLSERD
ncbi:MAG: TetR/AcrR family transcriptional regulator [Pseudomonadota bacterium]